MLVDLLSDGLYVIVRPNLCLLTHFRTYYPNIFPIFAAMVEKVDIVGRVYEQKLIRDYWNSGKSELVAVYGRRRVGKTYLVKKCFGEKFDFWFTGMYETPRSVQLYQFSCELERYSGKKVGPLKSWLDAFSALRNYLLSLKKERLAVFLDELPWMDSPKSGFIAAFSNFWNMWPSSESKLKLFICGSATTWMMNHIIGDKGGLYGRVCRPIYLPPFTLRETEQFLGEVKGIELGRYQILEAYMVLGGIPYYLDMIEKGVPLDSCIDNLFFRIGAPLRDEYDFLFRSLFKESVLYRRIVETLSKSLKGMTREQIRQSLKFGDGGRLTEALDNLCQCDFIRRYSAIGKSGKDMMYQLCDLFSLYHLNFVMRSNGQDERFWSNMSGSGARRAWSGYAFEQVCLHHLRQLKETLGISGILSNACSWSCKGFVDADGTTWPGGQVDLVIDRNDSTIDLCEMKFCRDEFVIDADYDKRLRERMSLFQKVTGTKKSVRQVFVTTYGVKTNSYSSIVQSQVTIDGLFRE